MDSPNEPTPFGSGAPQPSRCHTERCGPVHGGGSLGASSTSPAGPGSMAASLLPGDPRRAQRNADRGRRLQRGGPPRGKRTRPFKGPSGKQRPRRGDSDGLLSMESAPKKPPNWRRTAWSMTWGRPRTCQRCRCLLSQGGLGRRNHSAMASPFSRRRRGPRPAEWGWSTRTALLPALPCTPDVGSTVPFSTGTDQSEGGTTRPRQDPQCHSRHRGHHRVITSTHEVAQYRGVRFTCFSVAGQRTPLPVAAPS